MHIHRMLIATLSVLIVTAVGSAQSKRTRFKFKVGDGGITAQEHRKYLSLKAKEVHKDVRKLSSADQAQAKQTALDDEVLYQSALKSGIIDSAPIRKLITKRFRLLSKDPKHQKKRFTNAEKRAYYNSHKSRFTYPAKMRIKMFQTKNSAEARKVAAEAKRSVASMKSWRDLGWKEEGDKLGTALSSRDLKKLYRTDKYRVCGPLVDRFRKHYIFCVTGRRAKKQLSFARAGRKLEEQMARAQRTQKARSFGSHKVQQDDEQTLQAALKAGYQRHWRVRTEIIKTFVTNSKTPRAKLLRRLRTQYGVPTPR